MNYAEIRQLLDRALDTGQRLNHSDLTALARFHRSRSLNQGFLVAIGQRFRPTGIPLTLAAYVKSFVKMCIEESRRYSLVNAEVDTIPLVEARLYVGQLVALAREIGLTIREMRYLNQLYGLSGFTELSPWELADQDGVARAYVSKVRASFERKLRLAAVIDERTGYQGGEISRRL